MHKFTLISFCNLSVPTSSPLLCMRISDEMAEPVVCVPVNLGFPVAINTATGLAKWNKKIFVLFASAGSYYVSVLRESDLSLVFFQQLPEIKDGHSILADDSGLYVVSTGTDKVLKYAVHEKNVSNPRVVWQASVADADTNHVNSITQKGGELFISAFGPKEDRRLWASARKGYIHNITKDMRVKDDIYHPHSLSVRNNRIYYCESHLNTFCSLDEKIFDLDGYTRGIGWLTDELVCAGTSIGRKVSKSTGIVGNPDDPGKLIGLCSLYVRNLCSKKALIHEDVSWYGKEIYDLLVLDVDDMDLIQLAVNSHLQERKLIDVLAVELSQKNQTLQEIIQGSKAWKFVLFARRVRSWLWPFRNANRRK